ncbi:hypothetical protein [Rhodococcus sp. MEB064]|uniref:hypothetical protein n=1 Tax=Rhodococcus sp. MEB064 TaxID=1587522 RepID=UPI0005AD02A7|nr:hypothetical protein [Rhodococcus sp. MEB064]KIQ15103.1 hypothetical protein RU01_16110 [Rhodococcus sp. MEB064]
MATFLDRESPRGAGHDRVRRFASLASPSGSADSGIDRNDSRILAGALPVRHRIVVAELGLHGNWSVDTLRELAAAVGEHRPGGVVAWDLAGEQQSDSPARRIAANADDLLSPECDPRALSLYLDHGARGHEVLSADAPPLGDLEIEDVLTVLTHHRQTVVVHARHGQPSFLRLLDGADVVVFPMPHAEDAAERVVTVLDELRESGHAHWTERVVVVKYDATQSMSSPGSTDIRRTLGEAGVRTVLDVPPVASPDRRETDADVRRAWSHVAAVVTRPRGPVRREDHDIDRSGDTLSNVVAPSSSFDVTTATLRARSSDTVRRRRSGRLPVLAALVALTVVGGLAATVMLRQADPVAATTSQSVSTPAAPAVDPTRASGPAVITHYDDLYYRDRDATAAAALWDLSETGGDASAVADLQRSIDAVDPAIRHRIDITATANASVFDAVLTLTLPDGRDFRYDQQFTVRDGVDGFEIVRKIDCTGVCPPS